MDRIARYPPADTCAIGVTCVLSVAAACTVIMLYVANVSKLPPHAMRLPGAITSSTKNHPASDEQATKAAQLQADLDVAKAEAAEVKKSKVQTERLPSEADDASKNVALEAAKLQAELVAAHIEAAKAKDSDASAKEKDAKVRCAASYGTSVGDPVCCGQQGIANSTEHVCPASTPLCTGFVQGSQWGSCQASCASYTACPDGSLNLGIGKPCGLTCDERTCCEVLITTPMSTAASRLVGLWKYDHGAYEISHRKGQFLFEMGHGVKGVLVQGPEWLEGDIPAGRIRTKLQDASGTRAVFSFKLGGRKIWGKEMLATKAVCKDSDTCLSGRWSDHAYTCAKSLVYCDTNVQSLREAMHSCCPFSCHICKTLAPPTPAPPTSAPSPAPQTHPPTPQTHPTPRPNVSTVAHATAVCAADEPSCLGLGDANRRRNCKFAWYNLMCKTGCAAEIGCKVGRADNLLNLRPSMDCGNIDKVQGAVKPCYEGRGMPEDMKKDQGIRKGICDNIDIDSGYLASSQLKMLSVSEINWFKSVVKGTIVEKPPCPTDWDAGSIYTLKENPSEFASHLVGTIDEFSYYAIEEKQKQLRSSGELEEAQVMAVCAADESTRRRSYENACTKAICWQIDIRDTCQTTCHAEVGCQAPRAQPPPPRPPTSTTSATNSAAPADQKAPAPPPRPPASTTSATTSTAPAKQKAPAPRPPPQRPPSSTMSATTSTAPPERRYASTTTITTSLLASPLAPPPRPPALQLWSSPKCQNFYRGEYESLVGDLKEESTVFVEEANLFLPSSEAKRTAPGFPHKPTLIKRALTYEDIVVPLAYNVTGGIHNLTADAFKTYCIPYFVRTPVRAAKVLLAKRDLGKQGAKKSMLYTPIWKVGTTTTLVLVDEAFKRKVFRYFYHFHRTEFPKYCIKELGLQCHQDSTNAEKAWDVNSMFKFSFVRDPWDRFLAGVQESKKWTRDMAKNMRLIENMAGTLLAKYPHRMKMVGLIPFRNMPKDTPKDDLGVCEYKTQTYLLSNTLGQGDPIKYDFLGRMEEWEASWHHIADKVGFNVSLLDMSTRKNPSGVSTLKDEISRMAASSNSVVCAVCKIFLQDYVCFGYNLPEQCCLNNCKKYGITFSRAHLGAANCAHIRAD